LITVVIPVKNEEARIAKCIQAIRVRNRNEEIETIVVDNGSIDNTVLIAESFGCRTLIIPDVTVGALRNRGAAIAHGDILAFLDADCISGERWLQNARLLLEERCDVGIVTGLIRISDHPTWVEKIWSLNRTTRGDRFEMLWASSMNMVMKAGVFREISGFDERLPSGEDVDLSARLRKRGYRILYDRAICVMHMGEAKTLRHLIRKERWRGLGTLDRFLSHPEYRTFVGDLFPPILMVIASLLLLLFLLTGKFQSALFSFALLVSFPLLRTILVSIKIRSPLQIPGLFIVWSTYYYARILSSFDGLKNRYV